MERTRRWQSLFHNYNVTSTRGLAILLAPNVPFDVIGKCKNDSECRTQILKIRTHDSNMNIYGPNENINSKK